MIGALGDIKYQTLNDSTQESSEASWRECLFVFADAKPGYEIFDSNAFQILHVHPICHWQSYELSARA